MAISTLCVHIENNQAKFSARSVFILSCIWARLMAWHAGLRELVQDPAIVLYENAACLVKDTDLHLKSFLIQPVFCRYV
jgi:hypothetical protein